ncbi:MAG: glutamate--tRNA ligase [Pseudomonadota bacterium]
MSVIVRFAPSPTGYIHIGNLRTALFNWLFAKQRGGQFVLRYDDTDTARSKQEFAEQIAVDLGWIGIEPHRVEYQSKRMEAYDAATQKLKDAGVLYPCYETPEELERRRKIRLSRKLPPVYGREALKLTDDEKAAFEAEGRTPHWRFLLPNHDGDPFVTKRTEVTWDDAVRGSQTVDLASMSDPVLIRGDGSYLYTLPSVVDDIDMGVTHIIRGDDHVTNTGAQIAVFNALDATAPAFGHHNLLTTADGSGLSKRTGALSIMSLHEAGYEPMAVASLAVLTGSSANIEAKSDMDALADAFEISATTKSAAKFDPADIATLNEPLVHALEFEDVKDRLLNVGIDTTSAIAEQFWLWVRDNVKLVSDAGEWWPVVTDKPSTDEANPPDDIEFLRQAFDMLPEGEPTRETWSAWTSDVKKATGRKGGGLFKPLRIALTGRKSGPEIQGLLPLLGREEILARRP